VVSLGANKRAPEVVERYLLFRGGKIFFQPPKFEYDSLPQNIEVRGCKKTSARGPTNPGVKRKNCPRGKIVLKNPGVMGEPKV